jgi:hypothetical protein
VTDGVRPWGFGLIARGHGSRGKKSPRQDWLGAPVPTWTVGLHELSSMCLFCDRQGNCGSGE